MLEAAKIQQRYEQLEGDRQVYLDRARECARVTIPTLMPEDGHTASSKFVTPHQSIGARGVNILASKLLLSLLPPNTPFFRLTIDDFELQQLANDPNARASVEEKLNEIERSVQNEIETTALRAPLTEALKQLIVSGNVLVVFPKDSPMRVFRLNQYVVTRDGSGNLLEVIIKESIAPEALPQDVKDLIVDPETSAEGTSSSTEDVNIYTKYWLDGSHIHTCQIVEGHVIPGSEGKFKKSQSPVLPLRWAWVDNENYGRSYVEEYLGDLISIEGLSKAILEASAAAAKVVFLRHPAASLRAKDFAEAENLAILTGEETDLSVVQVGKQADMAIAEKTMNEIIQRLSYAFLMNTAVQRQAERVTAEEIRYMIGELEDALGGVYALLSQELQLPMVRRIMDRMQKQKRLPKLPDDVVTPQITTGVEALGRGHDLNKYEIFVNKIVALLGDEGLRRLNIDDLLKRTGTALGIDMDGLVKTQEQLDAEAQADQQKMMDATMAEAGKAAVAPAISAAAKGM